MEEKVVKDDIDALSLLIDKRPKKNEMRTVRGDSDKFIHLIQACLRMKTMAVEVLSTSATLFQSIQAEDIREFKEQYEQEFTQMQANFKDVFQVLSEKNRAQWLALYLGLLAQDIDMTDFSDHTIMEGALGDANAKLSYLHKQSLIAHDRRTFTVPTWASAVIGVLSGLIIICLCAVSVLIYITKK